MTAAEGAELLQLRCLVAVAEHGSGAGAAAQLGISPHVLSQQIGHLEDSVGARLVDSACPSLRLTGAGQVCADHARRALSDLAAADRAVHRAADVAGGTLRLAMAPTFAAYLIGPLVAELNLRHPGITVTITEMPQDRIEAGLLADELDAGVAFIGRHARGIAAHALFTETLSLVVAASDAGRVESRPVAVRELADRQLALLSTDFDIRERTDRYFAEHGVAPRVAVETNSVQALTELVQRTPALVTVLPDAVTDDSPHLRPVPVEPPLPSRRAALLVRDGAPLGSSIEAYRELVAEVVRDRGYASP
ncbi:transcriptional regulator CynR [Streptomyces sp. YIM 130001]|uniref:transcriptional regulator CynR n=1 Tax=Streptomyces sp. YIM 130001 TaxID=2259644 RepID=UPI001F0984E9|nr:transcriptional regulator CynR [Streptomyces sp. YIM 130001]